MDELEALHAELAHYRQEKDQIRDVIGQIGGKSTVRRDAVINVVFLVLVLGLFFFDVIRHVMSLDVPFLPTSLLMEIAVLLVSVKIIWMIHLKSKVDHFQFWILNSIEFRMNMISRRLTTIEEAIQKSGDAPGDDAS